jgi:peptide/nickel transport system substrate-binding protein
VKKLFACVVAAVMAATSVPALAATPRDTLVMAWTFDDIISLDPAEIFEFSAAEFAGNTYDRLIGYDPDDVSNIYGKAVESWTISDDGKTFTFKMRPGIVFASGNPMTAEDAVFSLQRAVILDKSPAFILTQFGFTADNVAEKIRRPTT